MRFVICNYYQPTVRRPLTSWLSLVLLLLPQLLNARITRQWSYEEMFDKADLVVIATAMSSKDVGERTVLPDYTPMLNVVGVLTEFEPRVVMKGAIHTAKFLLFHYRYESEDDQFATANTPELIRIKAGTRSTFLLFLVKERGSTYSPVTGQTDPAALSVLDLRGGAN